MLYSSPNQKFLRAFCCCLLVALVACGGNQEKPLTIDTGNGGGGNGDNGNGDNGNGNGDGNGDNGTPPAARFIDPNEPADLTDPYIDKDSPLSVTLTGYRAGAALVAPQLTIALSNDALTYKMGSDASVSPSPAQDLSFLTTSEVRRYRIYNDGIAVQTRAYATSLAGVNAADNLVAYFDGADVDAFPTTGEATYRGALDGATKFTTTEGGNSTSATYKLTGDISASVLFDEAHTWKVEFANTKLTNTNNQDFSWYPLIAAGQLSTPSGKMVQATLQVDHTNAADIADAIRLPASDTMSTNIQASLFGLSATQMGGAITMNTIDATDKQVQVVGGFTAHRHQ